MNPAATDPLVEELQRRRSVAITEARRVLKAPGADVGATLFMSLHAAKTCDEALQMLARLDESVPA